MFHELVLIFCTFLRQVKALCLLILFERKSRFVDRFGKLAEMLLTGVKTTIYRGATKSFIIKKGVKIFIKQ